MGERIKINRQKLKVTKLKVYPRAPIEQTLASLCRAQVALKRMEFLEIPIIDETLDNIQSAILDLCGVPEDNVGVFLREWLYEPLEEFLESNGDEQDYRELLPRIQRLLEKKQSRTQT